MLIYLWYLYAVCLLLLLSHIYSSYKDAMVVDFVEVSQKISVVFL